MEQTNTHEQILEDTTRPFNFALKVIGRFCEKCGAIGTEVHHKIHLTPENVSDPEISLSQDNLMLLCNECHNKEYGRFEGKKEYEFDADGNLV